MTDPQCGRPLDQTGKPVDQDVPDCGTGPLVRLLFVIRELAALWRHRRTTGED